MAASLILGWPSGNIGVVGKGRNTRSRSGSLRPRSRTKTGKQSRRWWWIGCRRELIARMFELAIEAVAFTSLSAWASRPEPDPWLEGCRRDDQRAVMSRFKRVLLTALAEQGVEQPIPSKVGVKTSDAPIGEEVLTGSFDAPVVRMVDQRIVRQSFDLCTPQDTRPE